MKKPINMNDITHYDMLEKLYTMCTLKSNAKYSEISFSNDEEKLFFAKHLYHNQMGRRVKAWCVDWEAFNLKGANTDELWKYFQDKLDNIPCTNVNKLLRKKSCIPTPELFDKLENPDWVNPEISEIENIDNIYKNHGKIIHRDVIMENYREAQVSKVSYDPKLIEYLKKVSKANNPTLEDCIEMQLYYARCIANKGGSRDTIVAEVPEWMYDQAHSLLKRNLLDSNRSIVLNPENNIDFVRLGIMGFGAGELIWEFNDDGDAVFKTEYPKFIREYAKTAPRGKLGLSIMNKDVGFTRCLSIKSATARGVTYQDKAITSYCIPLKPMVTSAPHEAGVTFAQYLEAIKRPWAEHKDVIRKQLDNLQPYHVCRQSCNHPWEFNWSAIALDLLNQDIEVHPDLIRMLYTKHPTLTDVNAQKIGHNGI